MDQKRLGVPAAVLAGILIVGCGGGDGDVARVSTDEPPPAESAPAAPAKAVPKSKATQSTVSDVIPKAVAN